MRTLSRARPARCAPAGRTAAWILDPVPLNQNGNCRAQTGAATMVPTITIPLPTVVSAPRPPAGSASTRSWASPPTTNPTPAGTGRPRPSSARQRALQGTERAGLCPALSHLWVHRPAVLDSAETPCHRRRREADPPAPDLRERGFLARP